MAYNPDICLRRPALKRQPVWRLKGMRLADAGELVLGVVWDGASVCGVDVRSSRPLAATVLKGKMPEQVMQIVPLLFGVCGRAQEAAAAAALNAARQVVPPHAVTLDRQIACEAMQEHLWRMLLDWPKLLGLEQQELQVPPEQTEPLVQPGPQEPLRPLTGATGNQRSLCHRQETLWGMCWGGHWLS